MKSTFMAFIWVMFVLASCEREASFKLTNPLDADRVDELIVLSRERIAEKVTIQDDLLPVAEVSDTLVPCQAEDLDGDGKWDELVLLINIKALENIEAEIDFVLPEKFPVFEKRTNVRLGILQDDGSFKEFDSYSALPCDDGFEIISQAEGVNWENDKMGFRVYFDCRNVKDLFGKLKPGMIVDKVQTPGTGSYHELADWGMDILHCGSSLGSGGIALLRDDSLFRLGSTKSYEYKKIVEGPVRSVFELKYAGWEVDGRMLEAIEKISVYPGKYWFRSDVAFKGIQPGDQVVTGIVTSKLTREPFDFDSHGFKCIGTHDVQSLNNDELGMAVLVKLEEAVKVGRTTDIDFFGLGFRRVIEKSFSNIISQTYYISQECKDGQPATHFFSAVWGLENTQWKTEQGFRKYLEEEMLKLSSPVEVQ